MEQVFKILEKTVNDRMRELVGLIGCSSGYCHAGEQQMLSSLSRGCGNVLKE